MSKNISNWLCLGLMFLGFSRNIFAQEKVLYFVVASPYDSDTRYGEQYYSFLSSFNPKTHKIEITDTLATEKDYMEFVRSYDEQRFAILFKTNIRTKTKCIVKIDYDGNMGKIKEKVIGFEKSFLSLEEAIVFRDFNSKNFNLLVPILSYPHQYDTSIVDVKTESKYIGVKLQDLNKINADQSAYSSAYLGGTSGGAVDKPDVLRFKVSVNDNKMRIPVTSDFLKRPVFEIVLPDSIKLLPKETYIISVNNINMFVARLNSKSDSKPQGTKMTFCKYLIFNKKKNLWFRTKVIGNGSDFRPFGVWLAGIVSQYDTESSQKPFLISPGQLERKSIRRKVNTGSSIDDRFRMYGIYQPGILFLINTETQDYIEWDTQQGDSEILLVENDDVYYRSNDKLFKRRILGSKKLSEPELLIQDPLLVDVHWAFISKN